MSARKISTKWRTGVLGQGFPQGIANARKGKASGSINDFNDIGMAIVCGVTSHQGTSHAKRNPLEVAIPKGLPIAGAVLCDQVRTVDWKARGTTTIANAGRTTLLEVRARVRKLLGV